MAKGWSKSFYNSGRWKKCRDSYISIRVGIDGGVCEECRKEQGLIVHHDIPLNQDNIKDPEIALNHKNLKYVCKNCHDQYEGHGIGHKKVKPLCVFDGEGQPISLRDVDSHLRKDSNSFGQDRQPRFVEYTGRT